MRISAGRSPNGRERPNTSSWSLIMRGRGSGGRADGAWRLLVSDDSRGRQGGDLLGGQAEQPPVDVVVVLAERGSRRADAAGGGRELGDDVLHGQLAEVGVRHADDGLAGGEVRVLEHVLGRVDAPGGNAALVQCPEQV